MTSRSSWPASTSRVAELPRAARAPLAAPRLGAAARVDWLPGRRRRHRRRRARRRARRHARARSPPTCAAAPTGAALSLGTLALALGDEAHARAAARARRRRAAAPPSHGRGQRQGASSSRQRRCAWRRASCAGSSIPTRGRRRGRRLRVADRARGSRPSCRRRRSPPSRKRSRRCARSSAASARGRGRTDLVLRGPRGSGRGEIVREACRRLGLPLLAAPVGVALRARRAPPTPPARSCARRCCSTRRCCSKAPSRSPAPTRRPRACASRSPRRRARLIMTSNGIDQPRLASGAPPGHARGAHRRHAPARGDLGAMLPDIAAAEIASLYRVGVGAIVRCADGARLRARVRSAARRCTHADVAGAVRAEFETDLGTVATKVDVSQTWEDLVVPDDTGRTIAELVDQLRHRSTVLGRWGFQRKLGKGLGTTALFSGEPGTGKSMVAGLIAQRARPRALSNRFVARAFEMDWRDRKEPGQGLRRRRDRPRGAALRRGRRAPRQAHHRRQERQRSIRQYRNQLYPAAIGSSFTASPS